MKIYNWGILGAGSIARKFASDLKLLPNANLLAIGSQSIERAKSFAEEFNVERAYGTYKDLASDADIDIIYVASRHVGHYPDSILCMDHGKAVLCEKPVAMNQKQFELMVEAAIKNSVFFMEALWTRFIPSFIRCKDMIKNKTIGEVKLIESDFCFQAEFNPDGRLFNPMLGGGSLLDVGIYPLFAALEFAGDADQIRSLARLNEDGVDTNCSILINHRNGVQSVLFCSIVNEGRVETIIHGTKGSLRINKWWHTPSSIDLLRDDRIIETFRFEEQGYGYQYEAEEVMNCMDHGKQQSAKHSWENSRRLIGLLDHIRSENGIKYPYQIEKV